MHVVISHISEKVFDGEALSVMVPTSEGLVEILPKHEPLVATLKEGELTVRVAGEVKTFHVEKGVLEVTNESVTILL